MEIQKMENEGAAMLLDLSGVKLTPENFNGAVKSWNGLPLQKKFAIIALHAVENAVFNPQNGKMVCFCCGKNWYETHGRNFVLH